MSRYTHILLASVAAAALLLSGTFWQSAGHHPFTSLNGSHVSLWGSVGEPLSSLGQDKSSRVAAADKDSKEEKEDGKDDKDEEDGNLKELWDSVLLG